MTTDDSKAALAAALFDVLAPTDRGSLTLDPRRREYWEGRAAAILAALPPGWCGHEAEIARWRAALVSLVGDHGIHRPRRSDCPVCAALAPEAKPYVGREVAVTGGAALAPALDDIHGTPTFSD